MGGGGGSLSGAPFAWSSRSGYNIITVSLAFAVLFAAYNALQVCARVRACACVLGVYGVKERERECVCVCVRARMHL